MNLRGQLLEEWIEWNHIWLLVEILQKRKKLQNTKIAYTADQREKKRRGVRKKRPRGSQRGKIL